MLLKIVEFKIIEFHIGSIKIKFADFANRKEEAKWVYPFNIVISLIYSISRENLNFRALNREPKIRAIEAKIAYNIARVIAFKNSNFNYRWIQIKNTIINWL